LKFVSLIIVVINLCGWSVTAQHSLEIIANLNTDEHRLDIQQKITYHNLSEVVLDTLYFTDWANSYSSKTTPLAKQFAYLFKSNFHFENNKNRGRTDVSSITYQGEALTWQRGKEVDILYVVLPQPLLPQQHITLELNYQVKLPDDKFTRFGYSKNGNYKLNYWFIAPAVFDGSWRYYSNKDLDDFYMPPSHFSIHLTYPTAYELISDLDFVETIDQGSEMTSYLSGKNRTSATLYLFRENPFNTVITENITVQTSIYNKDLISQLQAVSIDRIVRFLEEELGPYPFEKIVISQEDYRKNPAYGLNQLPHFIRPFPDGFQYDLESFKTLAGAYLKNTLLIHPREEHWLRSGLQIYLLKKYTDRYYPEMKIFGNLSNVIGLRWFHASTLQFNDQYELLYQNSVLLNLDQPVAMQRDSLIKYNAEIASAYKTGVGFKYLSNYLGENILDTSIHEFYRQYVAQPTSAEDFEKIVKSHTTKELDWFFEDYITTNKKIDYQIKKIKKKDDSLVVTLKNNRDFPAPFTLYSLDKKEVQSYQWVTGFTGEKKMVIPAHNADRLAIDYPQEIPDFNKRNNYRKVSGIFKKPLQFRLLQDIEDPEYQQFFFMPVFEYNFYDGLLVGTKLYNKTFLPRNFNYRIEPMYGLRSNMLLGGGSLSYSHPFENQKLYSIRVGASGRYFSYDEQLFYRRFIAYATASFRNIDLRSNERQYINLRNIYVDKDPDPEQAIQEPNYNVVNAQYVYTNVNLLRHFRFNLDYEIASDFQKLSTTLEFRRLFLSNRQINLRLFAGTFLKNETYTDSHYFSFALDRPTDYMFDYNYYGRSESTGLWSQQLILAEGGFKSKMTTPFANNWMATLNMGTNIWRWIHIYGDLGFVNNRGVGTEFFYDSGIRLSLVDDFFEVYFPLQSSLGWEPALPRYDERIRFIVTLQPEVLIRLFTRRWY
jgi:hypothetical protein